MPTYTPLINNTSAVYNGYPVKLGSTPDHLSKRPILSKVGNKKIVFICIGASTPGQISTQLEKLGNALVDVDILNCCVGAQDINDWLMPDGAGWKNVTSTLSANGYTYADVQGIIMCHDDLRDGSNAFPASAIALKNKMKDFVSQSKGKCPNLKHVELFSRLCEYKVTDTKFVTPSGYHNGWSNKFLVEDCIANNSRLNNVWVNDSCGYLWTDGETVRSDGFAFKFAWMKQRQTSIHLDTTKEGDDVCAKFILDNMKRTYAEFK